jgi:FecR protein
MPAKLSRSLVGCLPILLACWATPAQTPPASPSPPKASPAQTAPSTARNQAGVIVLSEGNSRLSPSGGGSRPAKVGDVVSEGDVLISSKDGEVHVKMEDTGFVVLRPNSRIQIVSYRADGGDDDKEVLRLIVGGLRSITGWIGKFNPRGYRLQTATATIGIRGTDHEARYLPDSTSEGEAGTYDRVFAGETYIETPTENTAIAPNQAGFVSVRPRERPRLLASIPGFFRPGPHEAEINQKHAEIQKQIDQRREERRKVIAAKRAALGEARTKTKEVLEQNKAMAGSARQAAQEQRQEAQAKREALQRDIKAAQELHEEIQASRKALNEDLKSGQITRPDLRDRRKALQEKDKTLAQMLESIKQQRKAMEEFTDAKIDQRFNAAQERQKALHDQALDARGKRKSLEEEREATTEEMKALQQQEAKRYREELKKDRTSGDSSAPPAKPQ